MPRKPRADRWDTPLSDEQRLQCFEWARDLGYRKAIILIGKELHPTVSPPSLGAMSDWYQDMTAEVREVNLRKALVDAASIRETAQELGDVSDAVATALQQIALEAIVSRDPKRITAFGNLALQAQRERRSDDQLELDRQRFQEQLKNNLERAIDALHEECMGNAAALQAWEKLRKAVLKEMEKAA